jgi:hypothetical protein
MEEEAWARSHKSGVDKEWWSASEESAGSVRERWGDQRNNEHTAILPWVVKSFCESAWRMCSHGGV